MNQPVSDALISFPNVDLAAANRLAGDLAQWLAVDVPEAQVRQIREDELAQDFGATLAIVLGSTAITALARGVAAWLARRQDARLTLRRTSTTGVLEELELQGQPTQRTEKIIRDFLA